LNPLLEIFADLREYFKTKYDVVLQLDAYVEDTYDIGKLNMLKRFKPRLLNQDGVNILKCIPQREIANKMKEYDMFFYIHDTNWKNHKMIFQETFCLSVVEAQLCGLITFATNIGGLNDTLKSGKELYINRLTISDSYIQNRTQLLNKITEQIDILMSDSIDKHKCEPLIRNEDFYNWDYIYLYRWKNLINY
jgi:glycosyltransferase involved in cell wall biosynthesis